MQKNKKIWILVGILVVLLGSAIVSINRQYGEFIRGFISYSSDDVNVLVLGKGGKGHEAPDLTDTIIFARISNNQTNLISLPRDLWVPEIRAKLNSAYYWGKASGDNFTIADESIETITGLKVDYNLVVDFSVFRDVVDTLGGIEVEVKNSFTDKKYPIAGKETDPCGGDKTLSCRYETITFEKGRIFMNGDTALKFVRSRNADGDEGTDIAREARQQLVISAIKNKVLSPEVLLNPKVTRSLWQTAFDSIETDINQKTAGVIARKVFNSGYMLASPVIPEQMLINPTISPKYDRQYVFIPKKGDGDWSEIKDWFSSI